VSLVQTAMVPDEMSARLKGLPADSLETRPHPAPRNEDFGTATSTIAPPLPENDEKNNACVRAFPLLRALRREPQPIG
jgi:hypothetical protein